MAQTVDQAYAGLAGIYDPQTTLLNQQISQADVDAAAQQSSLDQAKVNAFRDIDTSANRKGVLFSGFSPDQQAQYVGTKYLPAVANLKSNTLNTKNTLASKIATLDAQRRQDAQATVAAQQKQEYQQAIDAQNLAYKQAQLGISQARLGLSAASARRAAAPKAPSQAAIKQQNMATIAQFLNSKTGRDGHVSQETWNAAMQQWLNAGYSAKDFANSNLQFVNQRYKGYHGYN